MSGSCVTMMMVMPRSLSSWKIPMISTLVRLSRLPVGSSARTTSGSLIKRTRNRDALLLAAGKLTRMMIFATSEADRFEHLIGPLAQLRRCCNVALRKASGSSTFSSAEVRGEEIEVLKNETEFLIANVGKLIAIELRNVLRHRESNDRASADRDSRACSSASICRSRSSP